MKLSHFLEQFNVAPQSSSSLLDYHVIYFRGKATYPLLFLSSLFSYLKKQDHYAIESIDVQKHEHGMIKARLAMRFLGNQVIYWLRGLHNLDSKSKRTWLTYLSSYQGPNTVLFFSTQEFKPSSVQNVQIIEVPDEISLQEVYVLLAVFKNDGIENRLKFLINHVSCSHERVSLDTACMLVQYACIVSNMRAFCDTWLAHIVLPKTSLFLLSQYFFAKKAQLFFTQLHKMTAQYSEPFWIAFWSDQLWRASMYTMLMKQKNSVEAQKVRFKLPFSFINYDWRRYEVAQLDAAHQFIYDIDYRFKNGSTFALDLFYSRFFLSNF